MTDDRIVWGESSKSFFIIEIIQERFDFFFENLIGTIFIVIVKSVSWFFWIEFLPLEPHPSFVCQLFSFIFIHEIFHDFAWFCCNDTWIVEIVDNIEATRRFAVF